MTRPIRVLLVEDNPADADLIRDTLEHGRLLLDLDTVTDGVEALDYLQQRGRHSQADTPDLILLDLNLPKKGGREVLAAMRSDANLRRLPVIVLTSSDAVRDVVQSYDLGANCYITKPIDLRAFQKIVQSVEGFWLTVVKLPPVDFPSPEG